MFIIDNYFTERKEKIRGWEQARDRYLAQDRDENGYRIYHRDKDSYAAEHPYPVADFGFIARIVGLAVATIVIVGAVTLAIMHHKPSQPPKPAEKTAQTEKCGDFKLHDHVIIQYGNYATNQGTIIGGCDSDHDYQVKLDTGQKAEVPYDGESEPVDVSNKIIGVDSSSNLVVIK